MTVQEIINATLRGSPYMRSCGHDAVTHADRGMLLGVITHRTGDIPCVCITEACRWVRSIAKTATRYNDAFKVFELSDHGAIERMLTAAKERRA